MDMDKKKCEKKKEDKLKMPEKKSTTISYRLKCAKTANGLSHFIMYGDVPREKTLV
ncbi:MAG: hypothetical protein ACE5EA_04700 [Nitrospirota bacterium]